MSAPETKPTADELAEALDDVLSSVPGRYAYSHEIEEWEHVQDKAKALLDRYRQEATDGS